MMDLTAVVEEGALRQFEAVPVSSIVVGSPDWFFWLAEAASFRFGDAHGSFTARKERAGNGRGGWYWKAYGSARRVYLGRTEELTYARLQAAAAALAAPTATTAVAVRPGRRQSGPASPASPGALPTVPTVLVGREGDAAEVARLLERTRLVTLTGSGGVGKTRLALAVANDLIGGYPDGVHWVDLAPLTDASLVAHSVAVAVGVGEEEGQPLRGTLLAALRNRRLLLLLDNCEHLIDVCAQLAAELLAACPEVRILATSRETLRVSGEVAWRVPSLGVPPDPPPPGVELARYAAVRLFVERAAAVQPGFTVTPYNAAAVGSICRRLDGIPLAIELAAARLPVLTVEQIAARLDDRFGLLTSGSRTALPRQRTLRATIEWSYDLLALVGQRLFRRLAVFAGGFTLAAAEAVCPGDGIALGDVLDGLAGLVDKSLVQVEEAPAGEARYRLPETVRQFAWERLVEAAEASAVRARHRDWCLSLAADAEQALATGGEQLSWLARLDREHDNLRAALEWCLAHDPQAGLILASQLRQFWCVRTRLTEARGWLERLLQQAPDPTSNRARALLAAGVVARDQGDFMAAQVHLELGLALSRDLNDPRLMAAGLGDLGILQLYFGNYARGRLLLEEGHAHAVAVGDPRGLGTSLFGLGWLAGTESEFVRARTLFEESLARVRRLGDRWLISRVLWQMGGLAQDVGDYARSGALLGEGLAIAEELGSPQLVAAIRAELGDLARARGELEQAEAHHAAGLAISRRIENRYGIARNLAGLGRVALLAGDLDGAATLLEESLPLCQELEYPSGTAAVLHALATVAWRRHEADRAVTLLRESLKVRAKLGHRSGIAACLEGLAMVAAGRGRPEPGARLLGAAEVLREAGGTPLPPAAVAGYQQTIAAMRASLGAARLAAARKAGSSLTVEEAVDEVMRCDLSDWGAAGRAAGQPTPSSAGGLTGREVEVLRRVANGETDPAIASSLGISVKTVHTHVSHILGKLACTNRTAAAAVAIRLGLV